MKPEDRQERQITLLRAAYDLILRNTQSKYVLSAAETSVFYDGANCDGLCLMNDIAEELNLDDSEEPLPLISEDEISVCDVCGETDEQCVCRQHPERVVYP